MLVEKWAERSITHSQYQTYKLFILELIAFYATNHEFNYFEHIEALLALIEPMIKTIET